MVSAISTWCWTMRGIETFSRCCVLAILAPLLGAQTAADGIAAFHRGRYVQARQMLEKVVSVFLIEADKAAKQ